MRPTLLVLSALASLSFATVSLAQEDQAKTVQELDRQLRINAESTAALEALIAKAEAGDARAMFSVFRALDAGLGAQRDTETAREWLERAVATGEFPPAEVTLGNVLANRDGDLDGAVAVWEQAADRGTVAALLRLAQFVPEEFGKRIQEALVANGQDVGAIDGILGPRSRNALDIYIASKDLTPACVGEVATRDCLTKLSRAGFFEGTQGQ